MLESAEHLRHRGAGVATHGRRFDRGMSLPRDGSPAMTLLSPQDVLSVEATDVVGTKRIVGRSPGQIAWARLKADRTAMVCAVIVGITIVVGVFAPVISWLYGISPSDTFT